MAAQPLIVAHRGVHTHAPENTIAAFEAAISLGVDMIEFDVRRTRDQILLIHHDAQIAGQFVETLTYQEICDHNHYIPTLVDVLECVRDRIQLDIELKEVGYEREVIDLVTQQIAIDQFVITSFRDLVVKIVKDERPDIKTGLLIDHHHPPTRTDLERRLAATQVNFLAPHWQLLESELSQPLRQTQLPLFVWTVNAEDLLLRLLTPDNVAGIITDVSDLALSLRTNDEKT